MDFSSQSNQSDDEAQIMKRQLYRPGQPKQEAKTPAAPAGFTPGKMPAGASAAARKTPAKSGDKSSQGQRVLISILTLGVGYYLFYGTPTQRRRTGMGLGLTAWLLFLVGVSYALFQPNIEDTSRAMQAIWQDESLTFEEKGAKFRELNESLTPDQRRAVREYSRKERTRKGNADIRTFLQMTKEQQMEELRKEEEKFKQWREKMRNRRPRDPKGGGQKGNAQKGNAKGNGKGGGGGGGGWGGGGGGGLNDVQSPESRAGNSYKNGLRNQMRQQQGGMGK